MKKKNIFQNVFALDVMITVLSILSFALYNKSLTYLPDEIDLFDYRFTILYLAVATLFLCELARRLKWLKKSFGVIVVYQRILAFQLSAIPIAAMALVNYLIF